MYGGVVGLGWGVGVYGVGGGCVGGLGGVLRLWWVW